jgi:hypothetical protein
MSATAEVDLDVTRKLGAGMIGVGLIHPSLPAAAGIPCPLRSITGIPCPFCGATRAVVALVHGHVVGALRYSPLGVLVAIAVVLAFCAYRVRKIVVPLWLPAVVLALSWAWNVTLNPTFH